MADDEAQLFPCRGPRVSWEFVVLRFRHRGLDFLRRSVPSGVARVPAVFMSTVVMLL